MTIYGRNSIEEALEIELTIHKVLVDSKKEDKFLNLIDRLRQLQIQVSFARTEVLDQESKTRNHQGIVGFIDLPENIVENPPEAINWESYDTVLALDGITDTGNLGAIIRSALLFQADVIVLPNDNSARITPGVIKSSAGAVYKQKVIYVDSLNQELMNMQAVGFSVYVMMGKGAPSILDEPISPKACLVIGSERLGVRKSVRKLSDGRLSIPTTGKLDSLNASVASAVALWERYRRKIVE